MRLPRTEAAIDEFVRTGIYVVARLRRKRRTGLAETVETATHKLIARSRAVEDLELPVVVAMAGRDAVDDEGDTFVAEKRQALAGRSLDAVREMPYTAIFGKGIEYFTVTLIGEQASRWRELGSLLGTHLDAADPLRDAAPRLEELAKEFGAAITAVENAQVKLDTAKSELTACKAEWLRILEKCYGFLVSEEGKKAANRYFPRKRRSAARDEDEADAK